LNTFARSVCAVVFKTIGNEKKVGEKKAAHLARFAAPREVQSA
jgi:hypothetical protein